LIVETAIEGPEYSWEGFVRDGHIWLGHVTAKETTGPPYFVEVQHRGGVQFHGKPAGQVAELVGRVLGSLGMRTGIVHLEFRLTTAGPVLMEVAVRTPGGYIMDLVGLTYGIDPYEIVVHLAMGLPLPPAPEAPVSCAATVLPTTPCGRVVAIDGLAEVRAHPHVTDAGTWAEVGGAVASQPSGFGRVSYAVLAAPDPSALDEAIAFVQSKLRVRTEPVP
jgi:cysteine synthase A